MTDDNRTFSPTIRDGRVLAGGVTLFELADDRLVFEDRFRRRCLERGTPDVPVSISELLDELLRYYGEGMT